MLKERFKEMDLKISELADYLQISRPTLYKFIEAYDEGNTRIINSSVLKLFRFIERNPLIGKKTVVSFILTNLVEEKELGNSTEKHLFNLIKQYIITNPESPKSQFIELVIRKTDFDEVIDYLLKVQPLLHKRKLSDEEIAFLKPFDDINEIENKGDTQNGKSTEN